MEEQQTVLQYPQSTHDKESYLSGESVSTGYLPKLLHSKNMQCSTSYNRDQLRFQDGKPASNFNHNYNLTTRASPNMSLLQLVRRLLITAFLDYFDGNGIYSR
ncbi:unnamed protein product [Leptidea sinapis]|uniref:Uncharacterized protein n=1 Tax=Leptidea sinapis TaxID=189913 RepID=A0A5E4QAD3_9NEOP|nr:unnamed protein product [Leptidea sinapis]